MSIRIDDVIVDSSILGQRCISREGYIFTSIDEPGNVYDALVIRNPYNVPCFSPRFLDSPHSLQKHIELINNLGIKKAVIIGVDIGFITQCTSLESLRVIPAECADNGFDFSPLYKMPSIYQLSCQTVYGKNDRYIGYVDYSRISGLKILSLSSKGHQNFETIRTLEKLGISGFCGKNKDLTGLFCGEKLKRLRMIACGNRSLKGIELAECIQELELCYNRSLTDISDITHIGSTLKQLTIENCPKINDFKCLSELKELEYLKLLGGNIVSDLNFLQELPKLKRFEFSVNVASGDLSPCLNIPYVNSYVDRRHYNLKNRELPPLCKENAVK